MSFMLIRLLQNFSEITLDLSSAPEEAHPLPAWAQGTGRKAYEKVRPRSHLTMYARVSYFHYDFQSRPCSDGLCYRADYG